MTSTAPAVAAPTAETAPAVAAPTAETAPAVAAPTAETAPTMDGTRSAPGIAGGSNPFRTDFHWDLVTPLPRLVLASTAGPLSSSAISTPMLVTGPAGSGKRATLDMVAARSAAEMWAIVRVQIRPGVPVRNSVVDALSATIARLVDRSDAGGNTPEGRDVDGARLESVIDVLRTDPVDDSWAYSRAMVGLLGVISEAKWGLMLCVDDLHAARPTDRAALIEAVAAFDAGGDLPAVYSATSRHVIEGLVPQAGIAVVDLTLTRSVLGETLQRESTPWGREFTAGAVDEIHRFSGGVAEAAIYGARQCWDLVPNRVVSESTARGVLDFVRRGRGNSLRLQWSGRLSFSQRRYLAATGEATSETRTVRGPVAIESVDQRLATPSDSGVSPGALAVVRGSLVRMGLLIEEGDKIRLGLPDVAALL